MAQHSGSRTRRVLWPPESLERAGRCAPQVHLPRARCQGAVVRSLARPWRTARSGRRSRGRGGAARMAAADDGPPGAARRPLGTRRPSGGQSGRSRLFAQLPGVMVGRTSLPSLEENRFIELKLALATGVRELRERRGLTQAALAHRLGSSQSRVAKVEAADRSVSLDLIMRSLLTIGATATDIAKWIKRAETARAA